MIMNVGLIEQLFKRINHKYTCLNQDTKNYMNHRKTGEVWYTKDWYKKIIRASCKCQKYPKKIKIPDKYLAYFPCPSNIPLAAHRDNIYVIKLQNHLLDDLIY